MRTMRALLVATTLLVCALHSSSLSVAGHSVATSDDANATPATLAQATHDHDHDHHDHDHDHDHDHTHGHAKHGDDHDHGHGANDHDHDHDGHDHEHHDHDGHDHSHHRHLHTSSAPPSKLDRFSPRVWGEALFATALVGAAPVIVLFFVPLGLGGHQDAQKPLLRVFLSFAAGGLLGDSLLHLLPHSLPAAHGHGHVHSHDHDHDHEGHAHSLQDLAVWLYCIAGMMTFLLLEKFVRAQTGEGHGHSHCHSHGHSHSHGTSSHSVAHASSSTSSAAARKRGGGSAKGAATSDDHHDLDDDKSKAPKQIAAAGYLNLAADFSHNFTDGLAIGATFLRGSGWQTTLAMLLHEVPHEIGDFAILIQSGFTRREAMATQLLTAVGAMVGTVIGLLIEGAGDSSSAWIQPFTAGGFIYIACASVMPELLEDCSLVQSLKEAAAMCVGIALMVVIALHE